MYRYDSKHTWCLHTNEVRAHVLLVYQGVRYNIPCCYDNDITGTSGRCSSQSPFRKLTGTTIVDRYFHYSCFFFSSSSSPSQPFLIEGVLGSKNLFCESFKGILRAEQERTSWSANFSSCKKTNHV